MWPHVIDTFILGAIGAIFLCDSFFLWIGHDTISGEINAWIREDWRNLLIFVSVVILLSLHFIFLR